MFLNISNSYQVEGIDYWMSWIGENHIHEVWCHSIFSSIVNKPQYVLIYIQDVKEIDKD